MWPLIAVALPARTCVVRRDALSPEESDFYSNLYERSVTTFNTYVEAGTVLHNVRLFDLSRVSCHHPSLHFRSSPTSSRC